MAASLWNADESDNLSNYIFLAIKLKSSKKSKIICKKMDNDE